jgi:hypothetical protein
VATSSDITFVCCVEFGWLEQQTVRMIESLRRFGGRFKDAPVIAVTPRLGPKLTRKTRAKFKECGVLHLIGSSRSPHSWLGFYNKPLALVMAEPHVVTSTACFVDSDLLFVAEPTELMFAENEDFLAFPVEIKEMGSAGPGDVFEPLWEAAAERVGITLDQIPWVNTAQSHERIRLYFNAGLMAYRTGSRFPNEYLRLCTSLLDCRIASAHPNFSHGFKEMVSAGFAAITLDLRWRPLSFTHNYAVLAAGERLDFRMSDLKLACIVHHHDSMWPNHWDLFLDRMQQSHPNVGAWLQTLGPLRVEGALLSRLAGRLLKEHRRRRGRSYAATCRFV